MTLTIEVRAKSGKVNELYQTLQAFLPTMNQEKDCRDCRVAGDAEDGGVYVLSCDWDDHSSFESYMRSGSGSALLGALDLLGESARIQVGSDAKWGGIETLKRMRKKP